VFATSKPTVIVPMPGVRVRFEYANVVYERPCPNGKSGACPCTSHQRYPWKMPFGVMSAVR
jgi:hypothetical protein